MDGGHIVRRIYGDTREDGLRRIRTVFILLPRGNGKTTLSAALGLLHLVGPEKEAGGQVVVAAADREQASIAYTAASGMIAQEPVLKSRTKVLPSYKTIQHPVLRWNFNNAVIDRGPKGDTARFIKSKSAEKIDGAVAAAMAIARAQASDAGPSIFESDWIDEISFN